MEYEIVGQAIRASRPIKSGFTVTFEASVIRREKTGVHALVKVALNGVSVARSTINVDEGKDVTWLANKAFEHLGPARSEYQKEHLWKDLDLFCGGVWARWVATALPEELAGDAEPRLPRFLLKPYVVQGGGTILFAPPGRGKSYVTMLMAVSLDAGVSTLWPVEQRKVLFVNLERSRESVAARLGNINRVLGLPRTRPLSVLNARGRSLADAIAPATQYATEHQIDCVFLDSISRAGLGTLTEDQPANRIIDALNGLTPTWFAIGHTPRADESHVFGSQHFDAGADITVQQLTQMDDDDPTALGVGLLVKKDNDIGRQPLSIIALSFSPTGLEDARPAHPGEFPEIEAQRKTSMKQEIMQYLAQEKSSCATDIAQALGRNRSNVATLLSNDGAFVKLPKNGREQSYGLGPEPWRRV